MGEGEEEQAAVGEGEEEQAAVGEGTQEQASVGEGIQEHVALVEGGEICGHGQERTGKIGCGRGKIEISGNLRRHKDNTKTQNVRVFSNGFCQVEYSLYTYET